MQLQCETQMPSATPHQPEADDVELAAAWNDGDLAPAMPIVEVAKAGPAQAPAISVTVSEEVQVVKPAPRPPTPPPDELSQAIKHFVQLMPGKPAAIGLENGLIGIVFALDPATQKLTVPFLEEHCGFQPYVPPPAEAGPPLNAHILIVEDAYISRLVLRQVVEQLPGCTVTEAVNGAEALDLLQKGLCPDLIVSDLCMPEVDGLQMLSRIRSTPNLAELEVAICTSTTDRESVRRAAELGVTKYLVKPFKPDEVRTQLREILTQASSRSNAQVEELKASLGLSPSACGELFHQLAEQVRSEIRTARNELGAGKSHAATQTLLRLRGSCALIKDTNLVARVQTVMNATVQNDMFAIVKGLEVLEAEGKRLEALSSKLRKHNETTEKRTDPLAAAARRVSGP